MDALGRHRAWENSRNVEEQTSSLQQSPMNVNNKVYILKLLTLYQHVKFDTKIPAVSIVFCSKVEPTF